MTKSVLSKIRAAFQGVFLGICSSSMNIIFGVAYRNPVYKRKFQLQLFMAETLSLSISLLFHLAGSNVKRKNPAKIGKLQKFFTE